MSDILKEILDLANSNYRKSESAMPDEVYDALMEQVNDDVFKNRVGDSSPESRMVKLPVQMGSLNKIKDTNDIHSWAGSKNIRHDSLMSVTPKYDGLSILVELKRHESAGTVQAFSRGDGTEGQDITSKLPTNVAIRLSGYANHAMEPGEVLHLIGEIIMDKNVFESRYASDYKNPRNMVAGVVGRKTYIKSICDDLSVVIYDIRSDAFTTKSALILYANLHFNLTPVPTLVHPLSELIANPNIMNDMKTSITKFELDGVVISTENIDRECETNSLNPVYSRAWKPTQLEYAPAVVTGVEWNTSKTGKVVPTVLLSPVDVEGVTISRATGFNARFIIDNSITTGTIVKLIRAGSVIPSIIGVVSESAIPFTCIKSCPACSTDLVFSDMNVDLVCTNDTCSAQNFKTIVSFFSTLDIDDMGEGNIQILIDSGYDTIESILKITKSELERLPGFGARKAEKLYGSINAKLKDIPLNVLQHASNMFSGLGSTKLKKLMKYNSRDNKPTKNEVRLIEGFGDNSADVFVDNFDRFWAFVETIPVTIKTEDTVVVGELTGQKIVFTGFRDAGMESEIVSHGGEIQSSLGKSTTILVVSAKGSGSSKEEKALKNGTKIMDKMEFKCYLDAIG